MILEIKAFNSFSNNKDIKNSQDGIWCYKCIAEISISTDQLTYKIGNSTNSKFELRKAKSSIRNNKTRSITLI